MNSLVLGIDSCSIPAFVGIVEQGQVLASSCAANECHAENLIQLIDYVLTAANRSASELESIAVTIGPGSFTGIRTGIAVGQGLASGLGVKLIGISSLLAQILSVDYTGVSHLEVCSVQEASPTDCYSGLYRCSASSSNKLDVCSKSSIAVVPKGELNLVLKESQTQSPLIIEHKQVILQHNPAVLTARAALEINFREEPSKKIIQSNKLAEQCQILMPNEGQQGVVIEPLYVKSCSARTIAERRREAGATGS